ncbi:LOW QUALITY PROTEIN: uncharacterized protein LOC120770115 [Bactrocera tryoni]|uniref:LOW QUALITY PROTEIN: uncharacterized protein LOC120770115 n=1 Tax=Bactrocera tryoni TaxID=59916 RepID=UPI001A959E8F|nr:LOW QUALITY PROTEIN: uncharacterized protein LOC120770115 [Bactrocera tryoni]
MGNGCSKCCQCNEHKQYHGTLSSASSVYRRRSRGELPIANSDRLRITQTSTAVQLAVEHVQREDAGHYTLIARTKGNDVIRKDVELIVEDRSTGEDPPVFLRRLVDLSVKVGTRTRLLVEIRSSTDVKLTWYRNDRRICENDRINEVNEGNFHYLEVSPVILEDGGQWMVLAENSGGRNSCIAHLNVLVPKAYKAPEFIEELRAVLTQQGTVSLECKVIGVPTPQLRWFKDSKEIKAGDVFALTANLDDPTSLGTYTCEAVNCMGKSYSSSKVHVVGRGSREGSLKPADSIPNNTPPPIFTNELRDMSVRIGEPIILGCQVVVPPWPKTVVWYNKNGRIESGERYKLIEDGLGVYMIEIKPSESCDEGEWKCVVTSYEGCMGISTCNVTMDIPKNYRKPRFMESLRAVLTEEGLVSFECKVVGFATPILKWFKDGRELKPGDVYQLTGTNSLGTYCCVAKNCMGESSSVAVLTVEDIQNQLNDEERLLFANQNQPPKFVVGLKSQEAKINESFQFTVNVKATPDPVLSWFRDELPIENSERYNHYRGEHENWHLDIRSVEFVDQAEWKCVAVNDFGTSLTSSYLKLQIPRHYKKPRFLECLRAVLTEEGAVNLECKVIGVPQPVLKWYKDGVELKPGDIHRIISGQDGTCCLGTYTCEARNCMGIVASSASLLGFEEAYKTQKEEKAQENELQRNFSLSTIQEEHTSQLYETPVGDITIDSKGEVSFSFDGKEVSVSLYETPDLTEEEALKIVEMYADQISEHVTEHNVVELPPLRFVKETSQSGKLLMEAVVIDISPEYFSHEEDMRTEAGLDDISITEITVHGSSGHEDEVDREAEKYTQRSFEKMEEELSLTAPIRKRKKSRPTETTEEFYSLSKASDSQAGDEDTSDLQTFASATQMSSRVDSAMGPDAAQVEENIQPPKRKKGKKQTDSDSSKTNEDDAKMQDISGAVGDGLITLKPVKIISSAEEIEQNLSALLPLAKLLKTIEHHLTVVENEVVEQATMMMTPASAEQSIAIIRNIVDPIKQVQSKLRVYSGETALDALFQTMEEDIRKLHRSLQVIEKCVEIDETGVTLIQRTSVCIIDSVGDQLIKALREVQNIAKCFESTSLRAHIDLTADDIKQGLEITQGTIKSQALLQEAQELSLFATISDAKLPNEADALKLICLPVVNLQAALEKMENELMSLERERGTNLQKGAVKGVGKYRRTNQKELQSVLETIGLEVILSQSSDNVQAGMLTVSTVESMVPPLQEIQNGLAQLTQDVERGHFNEEAALDSADTQKLLQTIAQSVLHFETNIERLSARLSPNVQKGLFSLKEEMSSLIGNVLDDNITKYHVTLLENLKRPIDELNYCIRQIESKSISGSLTDFIDPLHSLSDRVNLGKEIMHMSGTKQNVKNVDVLEKMQQLIRNVEIDIEEHEFKTLQHEVELDEKLAAEQEKSFIYMREAMEMKIAQDEAGQNIQELLHTLTEIEATPGLDTQTQKVLSQLDQSLTGLVADVEVLKESQSTREENEAATKVLTDIAKPLQTVAEVLRNSLTPEKVPKIQSVPQSESLSAVLQEIKDVVENIPDLNEHHIKLKALPIVQSVIEMVPVLQSITNLPRAITAVTQTAVGEKKKAEPDVDNNAAKKPKLDTKTEIDKEKITAPPKVEPVAKIEDEGSTLEDISAMKSVAESLPADSQDSAAGEGTDHLKAFEANKTKVNTLLSQLKNSIASVLAHCAEVDVASLQLESAQKVKACLSKLEDVNECIADVHQPIIVETLHTHADISNRKTFAEAVCHLETCVVQVEECLAQHDLQELSENSVSDLKTLALPLQDLKECIKVFHNEELEQVISLPTASLSMTSAQVLQDICPFVLSIKESNALETLQSLAADESLAQLQQFIQPIQELENAVLSTIHQVHLSQIEDFPSEVSIAVLEKCAKPILDIREALLHVQAETPQSPIEECPALDVVRQKADAIYNLLEYCERASLNALENITDMSTQADVSALKSCAELKSVEIGLEQAAKVAEESVKYLDVKECIAGGIKQIQVCLTSTDTNKEPELQDIGEVMKELKNELENMQNELSKPTTQQNTVKVNQRVAKTMFKLKECLVHTYETDVGKSLDEIEKTFEDILQALPTLEIHLAQEMFTKIDTSLCAFKTTCLRPDAPTDLQKLVDPINNILKTVKSISELKSIDIEKSSLIVAHLQTHLMSAFRVLNEVGDSLSGQEREAALRAQDAVLATHEFIVDASEQLRTIELLQEIDSLTPNLSSIYDSIALAKEQKNKQELLEALTQRVSSGKAFLQSIEEGLNANNPLYYKLAEDNEMDIRSVEAALLRIENEIIPKMELQIPTPEDSALVDVLGVHLKSLQDSFAKLKTLPIVSQDIHGDDKQKILSETSLISKTLSEEEKLYAELQQRESSLPADEDVSTLEDVSAIESLLGSPLRSHDEHIPSSSADVGKVDVLLSQLKSNIVSVLKYGSEVQVDFQELESTEQVKASLLKLEKIHECFADVGHPSVIEPPLLSFSEASDCKTFADAVCNLEACVVQVEECIAQSYLQDLSETEISDLKTLAQPLHDVRECIKIFQNEELEQVLSLPTISMPLTSAQVLQDIQPFVLSIKESHALETLQSLAEDESLVQLKQFIQPIQELQNLSLFNVEQVQLSQADSISKQENVEMLKRFAKPVLDIREALLQIQEETPLSTLEECVPLKVVREKIDVVYHLLQYCEQVDMSGVENVVDMSTQADISALKSCIEPQSAEAKLELPAVVAQENVKFLDVKESISNSIKQLEACATDMKQVNVPELREVFAVIMELGNELESMQNELSTASEQQHMAESQAKVAKVMFKLKDCLVHTYEAGVEQSLEHIETAFADLLQTMPILEIQLAQEMCTKMESAILEFSSICNKSESLVELRKLIEPLELVLNSTKAINKLQLIEVEKSTMVVANLQSHLMAVFRAVDQINEKIELDECKSILKLQNSVISITEFISTSENTLRVIELIQELDSLMPQLNSVVNEINAEKSDKGKQAFLEALTLSLTSGKAFIASVDVGLKSKNPVFVRLSAENSLDIQKVRDALVRMETEILPKMHSKNPSAEEGALVDTLRLHLKNLQAKLVVINNETVSLQSEVKESTEVIDDEMKEAVIDGLESKKYKQQEAVIAEQTQTVVIEAEEKIIPKQSTQSSESAVISSEQAPQETETATATITKKNEQLDSEKPSLPTEPYLQKTEELIDVTIELTRNLNTQQLSKATTEVFRSVEITLSEMKNLIQTHPSSAIEDHLFLPLFKLKDLIAFVKKSPIDDITKSMEMRQVIQNSNKVLLEILNGHQGLRSAMISDITEATLPYIGSIISFIAQVFPNDKELCATSSALQRISSEVAVIKKQNAPNMDTGSRSYQNLKSAIFDFRNSFESVFTKTQNPPLLEQREGLDRLCKAIDEGLITDAVEILQELEMKKELFVLLLEGLKHISQESATCTLADLRKEDEPKRDEDSVVQEIKNVLAVLGENEKWKDTEDEIKEALQNPTDERFSKLIFKMREHIVHTYEGGPLSSNEIEKQLEEIIDKLLANNPEATRKLTEEYYANIKDNKKHICENITKIENLELRNKLQTADYLPSKQKEAGSPVSKIEDVEVQEVSPDENEKIMQEPCAVKSLKSEIVALVIDSSEASELVRSIVLEAEAPQTEIASKEPEVTELTGTAESIKPEVEVETNAPALITPEKPIYTIVKAEEPRQEIASKESEATELTETAKSIKQKAEVGPVPLAPDELALTVIEAEASSKEPKAMELNEPSASVKLEEVVEQAPQSVEPEAEVEAKAPASPLLAQLYANRWQQHRQLLK